MIESQAIESKITESNDVISETSTSNLESETKSSTKKIPTWSIILLAILGLVIGIVLTIFISNRITKKKEVIKIGVILPITGSGSSIGTSIKNGLQLAVEGINASDGINGNQLELIIRDTKSDLEEIPKIFAEIEQTQQPLFYVGALSSETTIISPLAEKSQVPFFALAASIPDLTKNKDWTFRYWTTADLLIPPLLRIIEDLRVKNIGMIYIDGEFGQVFHDLFQKDYESTGGNLTTQSFELSTTNFQKEIKSVIDNEAIILIGLISHVDNLIKQLDEAGYKNHILTNSASPTTIALPEAEGAYSIPSNFYKSEYIFAQQFIEEYQDFYKEEPNQITASGYDLIKMLEGLLEDEDLSRSNIKAVVEGGFNYTGTFGAIKSSAGNHDISFPLFPAQILNGELVYK